MSNLFQTLELEAFRKGITPRTKESREWFRKRLGNMRRVDRRELMRNDPVKLATRTLMGSMQMFIYDPKHKETLPYYDAFPLTIVLGPAEGGFAGINLHYLPPLLRARFLDGLMERMTDKKYDESTRFAVSYQYLKKASTSKYIAPTYKHYLTQHVRSKFARIPAPEWEIATFLPAADWRKQSGKAVYRDTRRMVNG